MGKIKSTFTKVGLGIAAGLAGAAVLGDKLKKKLEGEVTPESEEVKTKRAQEKAMRNAQAEERRKQREVQARIAELSRCSALRNGVPSFLPSYIALLLITAFIIAIFDKPLIGFFGPLFAPMCVILWLLLTYIFILIKAGVYRSVVATVKEKANSLQHKLALLKDQKTANCIYVENDINTEIMIHQSALNNIATDFNKMIGKFSNKAYTKAFCVNPIVPSEKEVLVKLTKASK